MKYYKCDNEKCGQEFCFEPKIVLKGYQFPHKSGILIPMEHKILHFCSPQCFEDWMKDGLEGS